MNRPIKRNKPRTTVFKFDISTEVEKAFLLLCVEISSDWKKKTGFVKSRQTILGGIIKDWVDLPERRGQAGKHTQ